MHLHVDTNVLIPAEPTAADEVEPTTSVVVELSALRPSRPYPSARLGC